MPLKSGKDPATLQANIHELIQSGRPPKQAAAIAYSKAGIARNKTVKGWKRS